MIPLVANLTFAAADLAAILVLRRTGSPVYAALVAALGLLGLVLVGRFALGWGMFGLMQATCWGLFLHAPMLLGAVSIVTRRALPALLGGALALVGVDAFLVEPRWLEVTTTRIAIEGLEAPLRILLVADLQTDHIGAYERASLQAVKDAKPDLVLFAGDYVQSRDPTVYAAETSALNVALRGLVPPLGGIAVRGDVDGETWPAIFAGLPIVAAASSRTFDLGPIVVTALAPEDAASARPPIPLSAKPHLVLAHRPDVALTAPNVDLVVAGHIHGGQVRLPVFGPLITLSKVPRGWSVGLTRLPEHGQLYVSRGIGMERSDAPRLRFLCRPELAILDLEPAVSSDRR
jgi:predicted MPP superfamily phosphohydrolase